ncbi:MAG: O-antigen ligase family protein [Candidatus Methylomirabilales bacterium]
MNLRVDKATEISLLFAALAAVGMGLLLVRMTVPLALGVGLGLAVLIITIASDEFALYLLIFSMLLGPEFIVGELGKGTTLGRGLTFRIDDVLIVIIGFAWLAKAALHKELGLFLRTPLNRPIAAYSFAAVLATGLGMIVGDVKVLGGSLFVLKALQYFVIYFMVVNNLRERRQFRQFLVALLVTAAIASLIGILQIPSGARVSAPFEGSGGEPNTFGGYLVLMLAIATGVYLSRGFRERNLALSLLVVLMVVPLLFTLSRASYLAMIPMVGALLAFGERKLVLASVLAVGLVLAPFLLPKAAVDRVLYTFTQPFQPGQTEVGGVRLDTSTSARLRSWREVVFTGWPKRPVFGYGVTGFEFIDSQYLRVLVETGAVGLLAFLWLQISLFRRARDVLRATQDPLFKGVAVGFLAGFIALVVHSFGTNTFIIVRIMEPFWFLAGMVMMIPQLEASSATPGRENSLKPARGVVPVRWW